MKLDELKRIASHIRYPVTPESRTDLQGTITAICDGKTICFEQEVCMDYRSGTELREELQALALEEEKINFVINKKSKKFHLPDCESVKDVDEKNKAYSGDTRDNLIEQGYAPCKRCKP